MHALCTAVSVQTAPRRSEYEQATSLAGLRDLQAQRCAALEGSESFPGRLVGRSFWLFKREGQRDRRHVAHADALTRAHRTGILNTRRYAIADVYLERSRDRENPVAIRSAIDL